MGTRLLTACLLVILLSACSTSKLMKVSDTMAVKNYIPPKVEPKPSEDIDLNTKEQRPVLSKDKISLAVRDSDIHDVLFLLSKDSELPIVADKDVKGSVTVNIKNKGLFEILDAVLKPLGYTAFIEDGIVRVTTPRLVTKTFNVNYVRGARNSSSTMNAAISSSTQSSGTNQPISGSVSSAGNEAGVKVTTEDKNNFWRELTRGLEVMIFGTAGSGADAGGSKGDKSGKKLILNEQAGIILVTDYSDNMKNIEVFINNVQNNVKRLVMIQAHIVEVSLNDSYSLGIDWNAVAGSGIGAGGELFKFSQSLVPSPESGVFQLKISNKKIDALLDAMKQQGTLNVLSSPRITAINNQKALVKLTRRAVSWIKKTTTVTSGTSPIVETTNTPQIDEVGIFLDVTPYVGDGSTVMMYIHPSISEITKISESPDQQSSVPIIDMREVDTIAFAETGQTIVIAGLIKDKIYENRKYVPVLGDLPVFGTLFSQVYQEKEKTELVILLTPYVLNEKSMSEMSRESEERLNRMERQFQAVPSLIN